MAGRSRAWSVVASMAGVEQGWTRAELRERKEEERMVR
jgi:hypothetical protein